jgi:hypothetical protein
MLRSQLTTQFFMIIVTRVPEQDANPRLCPELQALLNAELAAGNAVVEYRTGLYAADAVLVLLAKAFRARPRDLPAGVEYREVNDPHWWKAEYFRTATKHCIACRF